MITDLNELGDIKVYTRPPIRIIPPGSNPSSYETRTDYTAQLQIVLEVAALQSMLFEHSQVINNIPGASETAPGFMKMLTNGYVTVLLTNSLIPNNAMYEYYRMCWTQSYPFNNDLQYANTLEFTGSLGLPLMVKPKLIKPNAKQNEVLPQIGPREEWLIAGSATLDSSKPPHIIANFEFLIDPSLNDNIGINLADTTFGPCVLKWPPIITY